MLKPDYMKYIGNECKGLCGCRFMERHCTANVTLKATASVSIFELYCVCDCACVFACVCVHPEGNACLNGGLSLLVF